MEQAHCTLSAVKRYWDTQCVGGRHNFFWTDLTVFINKTKPLHTVRNFPASALPRWAPNCPQAAQPVPLHDRQTFAIFLGDPTVVSVQT